MAMLKTKSGIQSLIDDYGYRWEDTGGGCMLLVKDEAGGWERLIGGEEGTRPKDGKPCEVGLHGPNGEYMADTYDSPAAYVMQVLQNSDPGPR